MKPKGVMLAKTQIGVKEYLALALPDQPEPDYVRGEVVERSMPTLVHAQIQALLVLFVSPDDRYNNLTQRLEDYRRWGVPHVWLVDPWLKRLYEYTEAGLLQQPALRLPEFDFSIGAEDIFRGL